ncbi:hypothetical protein RHMOL_Rhmol12G0162800 [Rhododendron molle]|uniref:Uncharacterized protein n=1 Tax=Rhododendron molle TaxID=49168 RepID=A0ACC0LJ35_RHOML|nr:hypothetical protein RHMOL_Rhmol12G0162800 [Rhododendron molle]
MMRHSSVVELAPLELLHLPVMGKKAMVDKSNYFNEATELETLVCSLKTPFPEENKASDKIPLKLPENKPFRKRKYAEVQLDELEIITKQVSVVTERETSGISFVTPESQQSVDSKPIGASDWSGISFVTPESQQSVDSKPIGESDWSGISFVTPESQQSVDSKPIGASDRSGFSFVTPESQQSVDSKPLRASDRKKVKNEKLMRSNCQGLESKKGSILNFFSRV